jgi:P27 family predicted phage terminase small subunit
MGRPRKPTAALDRAGTRRQDRHGDRENEPKFVGLPERPTDLSPEARKHWDQVVPKLIDAQVATAIDAAALVQMCESWAEVVASRKVKVPAYDLDGRRKRQMMINGALKAWRDLASRFGLTPVDRAKLEVDPGEEENDPFEAMLRDQVAGKAARN